jgi:GrpB-like predicted nucleotidyltransferase (UPF0157 family)
MRFVELNEMPRRVEVVTYNPEWPQMYDEESHKISSLLSSEIVSIHHIGSTAIPGIFAKPVIDILVVVEDIDKIDNYNPQMASTGYIPRGEYGIPGRRFFIKPSQDFRSHHVHIYQTGNPEIEPHFKFRDYMLAHPDDARIYSELKKDLAFKYTYDIDAYVDGKKEYIEGINAKLMGNLPDPVSTQRP